MSAEHAELTDEAESIFRGLGYETDRGVGELYATRKWRTVHVTTEEPTSDPPAAGLRCFVARADRADELCTDLSESDYPYDWAVISVHDDGYDVLHPDAPTLEAP
ncbi:MAG: hypothetical protein U5K28_07500 [Halobacteriales archaeon]|nr:hypothetical protein [Halobacteriales archaeon]